MTSYEQLGLFYLGRRFDAAAGRRLDEPLLYDSKDLLTHAVCVGMTGSGKTGLGIGLIEEAAIDGIPVLAIDPKGDLSNLLLTFPDMSAADLAPWVAPAEGPGAGADDSRAAEQAAKWRSGLAEWDQTPDRIARLQAAADVRVYTPGSRAGTPLALLQALGTSPSAREEDAAAAIATRTSSLLTLAGLPDAAPHKREHTLVSTILASPGGARSDLPWLVQQIQRPSFERVGVLDLETFYPASDRQELALRFNSVLASPGFDVWLHGDPLDVGSMLHDASGRPRIAIVSIAHLGDTERMLVVSMVLEAVLDWTRRQSGTNALRALVYMDEVFGYLPPVANPPSKRPLLTLLKQARAFGVGMVVATQNPVDLDYKALSNAGTWFLGRLQTERDKARVLDGIEGLSSALDRATLDGLLSALRPRVFLMHNVHEREPVLFETRWTLSYLRGPMTREEIARACELRGERASPPPAAPAPTGSPRPPAGGGVHASAAPPDTGPRPAVGSDRQPEASAVARPVLPAGVPEAFLPTDGPVATYVPGVYAAARVHYRDTRTGIDHAQDVRVLAALGQGPTPLDWERSETIDTPPEALRPEPGQGAVAQFKPVPAAALQTKSYAAWSRSFSQWIQRTQRLTVWHAPALKLTSEPGETERDFRIRLQQAAREARDAAVDALRAKYATRLERLAARVRAAEEGVGREQQQAQQQKVQSAVSIGATMLGALLGRKTVSLATLGRATTAARGVSRTMKESQDVARAGERLAAAQSELAALQQEVEAEAAAVPAAGTSTPLETREIAPARGGVEIRVVTLAWRAE
jgi:hypothetical protein